MEHLITCVHQFILKIDLLKRNVANLPSEEQMKLMQRVCDVFNTNSFEVVVPSRGNDHTMSLRGLYPMGALQNHCCVPNSRHHFDDQQRLHVSAALPIAAGEEITMSYTDLLWDTSTRRQFLRITKRFSCNCNRCSDPLVCLHCDHAISCYENSIETFFLLFPGIRFSAQRTSLCEGRMFGTFVTS